MENINGQMMKNIAWERIAEAVIGRDFAKLTRNYWWLNKIIKEEKELNEGAPLSASIDIK